MSSNSKTRGSCVCSWYTLYQEPYCLRIHSAVVHSKEHTSRPSWREGNVSWRSVVGQYICTIRQNWMILVKAACCPKFEFTCQLSSVWPANEDGTVPSPRANVVDKSRRMVTMKLQRFHFESNHELYQSRRRRNLSFDCLWPMSPVFNSSGWHHPRPAHSVISPLRACLFMDITQVADVLLIPG